MTDTLSGLAARIANLERLLRDMSRSSRLANSSIEGGAIAIYDGDQLRGSIGLQEDGTVAMAAINGPPPPVPAAPVLASVLGGVAVTWDGTFADGSAAPADFAYVAVHFSTTGDFTAADSLYSAFYAASGGSMTVPASVPLWVRLVCVSTSGATSAVSDVVGPVAPAVVVAQEVLDGIITDLSLADGAVTRAKIEAGAVDGTVLADGAVSTPKLVAGEIDGLVLAAGTVNADRLVAASITADQIKALSITGDRLVANTITAAQMATGTITAASGVISSIDASVISVGKLKASQIDATNLVISGDNVNGTVAAATTATTAGTAGSATTAGSAGTVTVSIGSGVVLPPTQMGPGQIPQTTTINGGSILTGTLDAAAIKAGTITADKLDANAINGKVITGATVQTAVSGPRIVLNTSNLTGFGTSGKIGIEPNAVYPYIYWTSSDGTNKAVANVSGGSADANLGLNSGTFVDSADSATYKWRTFFGNDFWVAERINNSTLVANGGRLYLGKSTAQLSAGPSGTMTLTAEGGIRAAGTFRADNISVGTASITPVAGTPTSVTLSGGSISGTSFRGFVTPVTSLPGTQVLGVGCSNVSSAGMTIWLTRTNTTTTGVYWMIIGEN
ncbi:hypothetical protein [Streptomyces sp. NPDC091217]|uniref:hypothetical protein n=1 Tax=Streptomyces sp. NPDC091217 TaxID=3365975 RepID=UPI003824F12E